MHLTQKSSPKALHAASSAEAAAPSAPLPARRLDDYTFSKHTSVGEPGAPSAPRRAVILIYT
jgi:hypothetical protein